MIKPVLLITLAFTVTFLHSQTKKNALWVNADKGWAANSVNTVVFRKNSLVTFRDTQFIAYYDADRYVVIGKKKLGSSNWTIKRTPWQGNTFDAHNCISIIVDGKGYLHIAWDHHNNPLHYCRSMTPGSLELTEQLKMTGQLEQRVSYPEFYKMPDGNLLFFYRTGESGKGNLVIDQYNINTKKWSQLQSNLIDGEQQRSAYWQACIDKKGVIHISWTWRETPDVASNHDICYARSADGGKTWTTSTGKKYLLPITAATAESACYIPKNSELINQTSMFADATGHPYIATYWKERGDSVPQYHVVYNNGKKWDVQNLQFRHTAFTLQGAGTKRIPISRPQIIAWQSAGQLSAAIIFRDEERGGKISAAVNTDMSKKTWKLIDLADEDVGSWEPTYDTELWKEKEILHLFVEKVEQEDGEGKSNTPAQMVKVLESDIKKINR